MFKKKNNDLDFDIYEENTITLANKEDEILNSYSIQSENEFIEETNDDEINSEEEYIENEEYIEDEEDYLKNKTKKYKKIINIIFAIIIIILTMISIDVISVARYDAGPFFALALKTYKDGGSKAYYGIGYKVIKYNQKQGRKDKEIGLWNLKYNIDPITMKDLDLAIEMSGKEVKTYKKYYKKFVRINSTLKSIDKKNNKIILSFEDDGKKYSLDFECSMATEKNVLENLKENKNITIIGTITNYKYKTKTKPNKLYINNCYAEQ